MSNNTIHLGFQVTTREGDVHAYSSARGIEVVRGDLCVTDESGVTIALFRSWESAEKVA